MNANTYHYLTEEVQSADPARLIQLLYQRALRDLHAARELWPAVASAPKGIHLAVHAQCILKELQLSLNYQEGGELAVTLGRLYEYMQFRLVEIVGRQSESDASEIDEIIDLLSSLSEAWSTMMSKSMGVKTSEELIPGGSLVA